MRKAAFALAVVALALVAVLWVHSDGARGSGGSSHEETAPATPNAAPAELAAPSEPAEPARAPVTTSEAPLAAEPELVVEESDEELTAGETLELSGSIVVVDELGAEHPAEDGTLGLIAWSSRSGEPAEVEVRAGRWTASFPLDGRERPFERVSPDAIELGGRPAAHDYEWDGVPIPVDGFVELRARWVKPCVLIVRDRASGRELSPVLLASGAQWPESELGHPGARAGARALDLGASPVVVPTSEDGLSDERVVHVRSPGYGWARVVLDETQGGERIVLLEPAGALEVAVLGTPATGAKLRVLGDVQAPFFERALSSAEASLRIDALSAGAYRVVAAIGDWWDEPLVLAEARVEIAAGAVVQATLELTTVEVPEDAPFAGTLVLPPEWELEHFELSFELLDTPLRGQQGTKRLAMSRSAAAAAPGTYRWTLGRVQPGRYLAEVSGIAYQQRVDVPPSGVKDARIELPPPCTVSVSCVDDASGAEVSVDGVFFTSKPAEGSRSWSPQSATWNEEPRRWELRAPQGELGLVAHAQELETSWIEFHARPGHNEFVLRMRRATGLRLVLRDGATQVPWAEEWEVGFEPLDGQDASRGSCYAGELREVAPGRYRLTFSEIPGYEPLPEINVTLEAGVIGEHVIELVRAR